jgi:gliding motility-associated-like protein
VPNAFTPNGDGINDFFDIRADRGSIEIKIFNRWGNILFHSNSYQGNWDGRFNGELVADGVYVWSITHYYSSEDCSSGSGTRCLKEYSGYVTIIR